MDERMAKFSLGDRIHNILFVLLHRILVTDRRTLGMVCICNCSTSNSHRNSRIDCICGIDLEIQQQWRRIMIKKTFLTAGAILLLGTAFGLMLTLHIWL